MALDTAEDVFVIEEESKILEVSGLHLTDENPVPHKPPAYIAPPPQPRHQPQLPQPPQQHSYSTTAYISRNENSESNHSSSSSNNSPQPPRKQESRKSPRQQISPRQRSPRQPSPQQTSLQRSGLPESSSGAQTPPSSVPSPLVTSPGQLSPARHLSISVTAISLPDSSELATPLSPTSLNMSTVPAVTELRFECFYLTNCLPAGLFKITHLGAPQEAVGVFVLTGRRYLLTLLP